MSDIARQYPANQTPGGFAADTRTEGPKQYGNGKEPATAKNGDLAHDYKDDRTR